MKYLPCLTTINLLLLKGLCCYVLNLPTLHVTMEEAGMHRKLKYTVQLDEKLLGQNCEYIIYQQLSAAVYISTDELDDLGRMKKLSAVFPKFINIETFTAKAEPFTVLLRGTTQELTQELTLPIHFRYHAASKHRTETTVEISPPKLYQSCLSGYNYTDKLYCLNIAKSDFQEHLNSTESKGCSWQHVRMEHYSENQLRAKIPVGDANGYTLVFYVTILLSWTASIWTALRIKLASRRIKSDL